MTRTNREAQTFSSKQNYHERHINRLSIGELSQQVHTIKQAQFQSEKVPTQSYFRWAGYYLGNLQSWQTNAGASGNVQIVIIFQNIKQHINIV